MLAEQAICAPGDASLPESAEYSSYYGYIKPCQHNHGLEHYFRCDITLIRLLLLVGWLAGSLARCSWATSPSAYLPAYLI